MNLNSLTGSVTSGFKFLETTVERQVEIVKSVGEDVISIGETVSKGASTVGESVGEGVLSMGGTVGDGVLNVGENVGKGALTVGKGALTVGETVGKGAIAVGETVGEGVVSVGESALDCVSFIDGSVDNIVKLIRMSQNFYGLACRFKAYIEDDSILESTLAVTVWLLVCYFFQIWMVPIGILLFYLKKLVSIYLFGEPEEDENAITKSLKTKVEAIEEIIGLVRAIISTLQTILDKIFGFINLKSLHFSFIVIVIQVAVTLILMFIPINYLLMLWGISLYCKKFLKKKATPGKTPKNGGKNIVAGTGEVQDAVGDFMSLDFTNGYSQLKGAFGKLSSKSD